MPAAVAPDAPALTIATVRPEALGTTSEVAYTITTDQNAPWATAPTMRAPSATSNVGASAVTRLAIAITPNATTIRVRRSTRAVRRTTGRLATMIVTAHSDTSSPIVDADTPNSALIAGSSPAGIISTVTVAKTANARVSNANHGVRAAVVSVGRRVVVSDILRG